MEVIQSLRQVTRGLRQVTWGLRQVTRGLMHVTRGIRQVTRGLMLSKYGYCCCHWGHREILGVMQGSLGVSGTLCRISAKRLREFT